MPKKKNIADGRYIITAINGNHAFRSFLLGHNLSVGTVFNTNYSPGFSQLINITVRQKILSLRLEDFKQIECIQIA